MVKSASTPDNSPKVQEQPRSITERPPPNFLQIALPPALTSYHLLDRAYQSSKTYLVADGGVFKHSKSTPSQF